MSDGPHKTLPQHKKWKEFAEHADNPAYSDDDVCDALSRALEKDWKDNISQSLTNKVRDILGDTSQGSLLSGSKIEQLKMVKLAGTGNSFANAFIDCAIDAVRKSFFGEKAVQHAIVSALDERAYAQFRSIEEHYIQGGASKQRIENLRPRMVTAIASCPMRDMALDLSSKGKLGASYKLNKKTSLADGVPL